MTYQLLNVLKKNLFYGSILAPCFILNAFPFLQHLDELVCSQFRNAAMADDPKLAVEEYEKPETKLTIV